LNSLLTNRTSFIPVDLRADDSAISKPYQSKALTLAPACTTMQLPKSGYFPDSAAGGDGLSSLNSAEDFEVHPQTVSDAGSPVNFIWKTRQAALCPSASRHLLLSAAKEPGRPKKTAVAAAPPRSCRHRSQNAPIHPDLRFYFRLELGKR
jgi:hypothetical protein